MPLAIRKISFYTLTIASLLLLYGCTGLSKKDCREGNWAKAGYKDAVSGKVAEKRLALHNRTCGKIGIVVGIDEYQVGYSEGLGEYCTKQSGLEVGYPGRNSSLDGVQISGNFLYEGICPKELESEFLAGYLSGLTEYCNAVVETIAGLGANAGIQNVDPRCGVASITISLSEDKSVQRMIAMMNGLSNRSVLIGQQIDRWTHASTAESE